MPGNSRVVPEAERLDRHPMPALEPPKRMNERLMSDEPPPTPPLPRTRSYLFLTWAKAGLPNQAAFTPPMPWNMTRSESEGFL